MRASQEIDKCSSMNEGMRQRFTVQCEAFGYNGEDGGRTREEPREGSHGNRAGPVASDVEALPTAAGSFDVGVVKDKLTGQLAFHIVHLCSQQGQLGLLLNEHRHTILDHLFICCALGLCIVQCVCESIAATGSNPHSEANVFWFVLQHVLDLRDCRGGLQKGDRTSA